MPTKKPSAAEKTGSGSLALILGIVFFFLIVIIAGVVWYFYPTDDPPPTDKPDDETPIDVPSEASDLESVINSVNTLSKSMAAIDGKVSRLEAKIGTGGPVEVKRVYFSGMVTVEAYKQNGETMMFDKTNMNGLSYDKTTGVISGMKPGKVYKVAVNASFRKNDNVLYTVHRWKASTASEGKMYSECDVMVRTKNIANEQARGYTSGSNICTITATKGNTDFVMTSHRIKGVPTSLMEVGTSLFIEEL